MKLVHVLAILDCEYVPRVNRLRSFGYTRPNHGAIGRDFADLDAASQIDGVCPRENAKHDRGNAGGVNYYFQRTIWAVLVAWVATCKHWNGNALKEFRVKRNLVGQEQDHAIVWAGFCGSEVGGKAALQTVFKW